MITIPLIGVSTYVADASWGTWERRSAVLPESYFELVAAAGGRPLLLPPPSTAPGGPGAGADEVIDVLDGLVLTGGGDVDPLAYDEEAVPEVAGVDQNRDASERALLAAALRADMPVLAICRGCQVLNVELGGTLHQHLPDVVGHGAHRSAPFVFTDLDVETVPGTIAAGVFGRTPTVRCSHHQAIRDLGRGLRGDRGHHRRGHRGGRAPVGPLRPRRAVAPRGAARPAALRRARPRRHHVPARAVGTPDRLMVSGRVAVVTGASRGLGAGLAVHFAASGMHLGLCARHRPVLAARTRPTAQDGRIEPSEPPVTAAVDVTDRAALDAFAAAVVARYGRIDLWVNNAGLLGPIGPLAEADPDPTPTSYDGRSTSTSPAC